MIQLLTEQEKQAITELRQQLQTTKQSIEFMLKAYERHNASDINIVIYVYDDRILDELKKEMKKLMSQISQAKKGV